MLDDLVDRHLKIAHDLSERAVAETDTQRLLQLVKAVERATEQACITIELQMELRRAARREGAARPAPIRKDLH